MAQAAEPTINDKQIMPVTEIVATIVGDGG